MDKLYGLQVDFCKINDTFLSLSKQLLKDKYKVDIESISIEEYPVRSFVLKHKNEYLTIPIKTYSDCYEETNEALKSIVKKLIETFPEDFIWKKKQKKSLKN